MSSVATGFKTTLSASATSTDNTLSVTSMVLPDGHTLAMADIGSIGYLMLEPGGTNQEIVSFTGISGNTFTGVTRGLAFYGATPSSVAANKKAHNSGVTIEMSNVHLVYEQFVDKDSDETIYGLKTFDQSPIIPTLTASDVNRASSIGYVNSVAIAGAPNATTVAKGIEQIATTAQSKAGTNTGSTGASLSVLPSDIAANTQNQQFVYWTDTGTANALIITPVPAISVYTEGQRFCVKVAAANTTASTINVNGLGVKNIKKYVNSALSNLEANDVRPGSIADVTYDGTQFIMETPSAASMTTANAQSANTFFGSTSITAAQANTLIGGPTSDATQLHKHLKNCGQTTRLISAGTGTQNIAHGLGVVPKYMRFYSISSPSYQYETMQCWGVATGISNQMCQLPTDVGLGSQVAIQDNTCVIRLRNANNNGDVVVATISALDATNITLNFTTNTGTQTTTFIQWEAES